VRVGNVFVNWRRPMPGRHVAVESHRSVYYLGYPLLWWQVQIGWFTLGWYKPVDDWPEPAHGEELRKNAVKQWGHVPRHWDEP
jgi:hypothetical protein